MGKLYPPSINGTIPAFSGTTLVVPFSLNRAVSLEEIDNIQLKIKTVSGVLKETLLADNPSTKINEYVSFTLNSSYVVGQYYKVQIAFVDKAGDVGYYSTVGVVKCTTDPAVYIEGLEFKQINSHNYYYTGHYAQAEYDINNKIIEYLDTTEKLYSSRFQVYDSHENLIDDTGYILHNSSQDVNSYEASEEYHLARDLSENEYFFIQFSIITSNGMEKSSPRYRITQKRSVQPEMQVDFKATLDEENGFIKLSFENCSKKLVSGTFLVSRCASNENNEWTDFRRFNMHAILPEDFSLIDCTVAHGIKYTYSIQQYNQNGLYSERIISNTISADFEDAFLYDGDKQLRIRYNPKVSTFKTDYADQKTDTIGSKHPFILRNGNMAYKEFPISGLISYKMDEDNQMFIKRSELGITESQTDLTSENIAAERIFKMKVLDWLNDGSPKLFRSPTEGNFLVRLMNVSLSPNDTLGRMLHTFTATAYEIADFTSSQLSNYNIINSTETLEEQMQWSSVELQSKYDKTKIDVAEKVLLNENGHLVYSVLFSDMMPGSIVYLDNESIMIGATGSYRADSEKGFNYIYGDTRYLNQGICTYSYKARSISMFGTINSLHVQDIPTKQFIGNYDLLQTPNIFDAVQDIRTDLVSKSMVRFIKRPLEFLYVDLTLDDVTVDESGNNTDQLSDVIAIKLTSCDWYDNMDCMGEPLTKQDLDILTLYQFRLKRDNYKYKDVIGEGYYVDRKKEYFSPYVDFYLDAYQANRGNGMYVLPISNDIYNITIDDNIINIDEIEKYQLEAPEKFKKVIPNNGVLTEFGYSVQIKEFIFDKENEQVKKLKKSYEDELTKFYKAIVNENSNDDFINYMRSSMKLAYKQYLNALSNAIKTYQEAYGLDG